MENTIFLINTLLGFFIALIYDILNRRKSSEASPKKFSIAFFWMDNRIRLLLTLALSLFIMLAVYFNVEDTATLFGKDWNELNNLVYLVIGVAPDLVIGYAKRKVGFLQEDKTGEYIRK